MPEKIRVVGHLAAQIDSTENGRWRAKEACAEEKRTSHLNCVRVYVPLCARLTT